MSLGVANSDMVSRQLQEIQHQVFCNDGRVGELEFRARTEVLEHGIDLARVNEELQGVAKSIDELKDIVSKVKGKAWPSVEAKERISEELKGLEASTRSLRSRVTQLSQAIKLQEKFAKSIRGTGEARDNPVDLKKRIVTFLQQNPKMPIGMFIELQLMKQQVESNLKRISDLEAEERLMLKEMKLQQQAEEKRRTGKNPSEISSRNVHGSARVRTAGDNEFLIKLIALKDDAKLKENKEKRGEALHALFNTIPREAKLAVYKAIGEHAGKTKQAAEEYGREHFTDSFTLVHQIVETMMSHR